MPLLRSSQNLLMETIPPPLLSSSFSGLVVRSGNPEDVVPQLIQQFGEGEVAAVALQEEVRVFVQGGIRPYLIHSLELVFC